MRVSTRPSIRKFANSPIRKFAYSPIRLFANSQIRLFAYSLILLAAALRFYRLGAQSLWSDEGNSLTLAQAGLAEIAARTAFDIHPPLYYWLLKLWLALFGRSEFAARSLSAMLGVLLVALIFRLGARFFGPKAGAAAAFMAAISPFQVYYAQEARMYMLLATISGFLFLVSSFLFYQSPPPKKTNPIKLQKNYSKSNNRLKLH